MDQARAHLDQVYSRVAAQSKASADTTLAAYDSWQKQTITYLKQQKIESDRLISDEVLARDGDMKRNMPPPAPTRMQSLK
jgi:hypothetical protein